MTELNLQLAAVGAVAVLKTILVVIVGIILIKVITGIVKKTLTKTKIDEALHLFFVRIVTVVLWVILVIAVLSSLGINTTSFVTVLGACGAAIALALKDSLGNIAGGIIIIMTKPFLRGEFIEINGTSGVVDSIDLLTTHLHTVDNKCVTIPNGIVTNSVLTNYSREELRRVDMIFSVSYDTNLEHAKNVILEVAASNEKILQDPPCFVGIIGHEDSAISIVCRAWCKTEDYFDVDFYMKESVKEAFDREHISIPFNQMDVHVIK